MRTRESGVTLMELLIAVTLVSLLSVGMLIAIRVGLGAMEKADSRLLGNRRVTGAEHALEQQIAGFMPVVADCQAPQPEAPTTRVAFFQGEIESMRFASSYSLQQGARGMPMILEFQVIPGENGQGVRLIVNERLYTGPRGAGATCLGLARDPDTGAMSPRFLPIETGPSSFVLADKLAYCRFSFREIVPAPELSRWRTRWTRPSLPSAIRVDMAPLAQDTARLQLLTITAPVHVTRDPLVQYANW